MTAKELEERQSWPLSQKIDHSLMIIETFIKRTNGNCYLAFSGGKDSTVLLDLIRIVDKTIPAVFCNTGNEWPEIIKFVHGLASKGYPVVELHPLHTPREVWEMVGFPLVSKEQSYVIRKYRKSSGEPKNNSYHVLSNKWRWLIDEEFDTSDLCCYHLKKYPSHKYEKSTGRFPIIGTMASESRLRKLDYLNRGSCNTFAEEGYKTMSTPLAIWTDKDIWDYIKEKNLEISEIYNKGANRTGCVGCGFGCHRKGDDRLGLLYELYPKYYSMIMNYKNNGVTYREALRKVWDVTGGCLPDEHDRIYQKEMFGRGY